VTDDNMAYWLPDATDTHSEYVILIAFTHQQWLHERASMFRHTFIACLVTFVDRNVLRCRIVKQGRFKAPDLEKPNCVT